MSRELEAIEELRKILSNTVYKNISFFKMKMKEFFERRNVQCELYIDRSNQDLIVDFLSFEERVSFKGVIVSINRGKE